MQPTIHPDESSAPSGNSLPGMGDEKMTVAQFVDRYYRPERLLREPGTRERIIASREQDMRRFGEAIISRHDSVTGDIMVLYNPRWASRRHLRWLATSEHDEEHCGEGEGVE